MPPRIDGDYKTMALVLTTDQTKRLRALAELRSTKMQRTSISEVAREVVEAGLAKVSSARYSDLTASGDAREEEQVA
jgi:hypothetical protein